jgi:MoaA/NifB/PqqE/SkfB family radical SAM enzyme
MCVRGAWREPLGNMPLSTFGELMAQLDQLPAPPTIHLSGYGEPTYHPDFLEIVRRAKATGAAVEITTNATLLTAEVAAELVDLDLDRLVVSLDGAGPQAYEPVRPAAAYAQVIANVQQLHRLKIQRHGHHGKPHIGLAFVAMKRNAADLAELPRLATRLGASQITVSNLIPHTAEMEAEILYGHALTACAYRASSWVTDLSLPKLDLNEQTALPLLGVFVSTASLSLLDVSLSGRNDYCRFAQQGYAAVRWDGAVSQCLSLLHDHPEYIRGRRKDVTHHTFGNVNERPLAEIWGSVAFRDYRARLRAFHFSPCTTCGGCERFPANFEDCTGNLFPACGGCLWAQGFVQCP